MYIPKSLNTIESSAFSGCNNIAEVYYEGTQDEWDLVRVGSDNGTLASAPVYYNYQPEASLVSFFSGTDDAVSGLPGGSYAAGAFVLPEDIPVRTGFRFLGWALSAGAQSAVYQPGDTVQVYEDLNLYAVWVETYPCTITSLVIRDAGSYEALEGIPDKSFLAEVSVKNERYTGRVAVLLAAYDAEGRLAALRYFYASPDAGQTVFFGADIPNADGKVEKVKAFVWKSLGGLEALAQSVSVEA